MGACQKYESDYQLFDFESDQELDLLLWQCKTLFTLSGENVTHGSKSLKLELYPSRYPGLSTKLNHHNWSRYKSLNLDVYNTHNYQIIITIRIDDHQNESKQTDQYFHNLVLKPGLNNYRISLIDARKALSHNQLNLLSIVGFHIYMSSPDSKKTLFIDNIRLSNR